MGLIGVVREFIRTKRGTANVSDVVVSTGGGANSTAPHFSASGDDAPALPSDAAAMVRIDEVGAGRTMIVGYIDPKNAQTAQPGDRRVYARDPETGDQVAELWLKSTGEITLSNALGAIVLGSDGFVNINGVTFSPAGAVAVPSSLTLDGKQLAGHSHPQGPDSAGNIEQDTGPNR